MKPVVLIPAAALCFTAGWWLDAAWDRQKTIPPATATLSVPPSSPNQTSSADPPSASPIPPRKPARAGTAAELLRLCNEWDLFASANIQEVLQSKSRDELIAFARDLAKLIPRSEEMPRNLSTATQAVLQRLLPLDPAEGMDFAFLLQRDPYTEADPPLMAAIQKVLASDPKQAAEIYSRHGGIWHIMPRFEWLCSLQSADPRQALDSVVEFDRIARADVRGLNATGNLPENWAKKDPAAAMDWALNLNPGYTRDLMLNSAFHGWVTTDPASLRDYLHKHPAPTPAAQYQRDILLQRLDRHQKELSSRPKEVP